MWIYLEKTTNFLLICCVLCGFLVFYLHYLWRYIIIRLLTIREEANFAASMKPQNTRMKKARLFQKAQAALLALAMAAAMIPLTTFSSLAANADLALYYTFDGDGVTDSSPNGKDAAMFGTLDLGQDGVYGSSLLLKGGYVKMPEDIIYGFEDITVSCWVNPLRSVENQRIWSLGAGMSDLLNLQSPCNEGGLRLGTSIRNNYSPTRVGSSKGELPLNQWSHVVVSYNGDSRTLRLYVDGEEVGAKETNNLLSNLPLLTGAYLGRSQWSIDPDFYGYIDDFKIYSRTLSGDEINEEAENGFQQLADNTLERLDLAAENGLESLTGVVDDLALPSAVEGVEIDWSSDNAAALSDAGKVGDVAGATQVTLTATATKGDKTQEKDFAVTVVPAGEVTVDEIEDIVTVPGQAPELPEEVLANGGTRLVAVEWEEPTPNDYASAGEFTVSGTTADGASVSVKVVVDGNAIQNPVVPATAPDPHVIYHDGYYYYTRQSNNNSVTVSKAKRIQDLDSAPRVIVYTAPTSGMYSKEYWAPELHYIDGNWYIYVAADDGNNANHRMYVLRCTDPNDPQAPYENLGKLTPTVYNESTGEWEPDASQDKWAIDGTVIQDEVSGRNYFVWSGWEGNVDGMQITYIAEMLNPYTLKGSRVEISRPDSAWDQKGHGEGGGLEVNEGQQVVYHNGKVYIFYSANFSGSDWYCLGQLTATLGEDLTNVNNWEKKTDGPLFTQSLDPDDHVYGVGHASIVPSPDGTEEWVIYHAFQSPSGGWGDRSARAQKLTWDGDTPVFGNPAAYGEIIDGPSGTPSLEVYQYEAEEAELSGGASLIDRSRASGGQAVTNMGSGASITFNVDIDTAGDYQLAFVGNPRSASGFICDQSLMVNDAEYTIAYSSSSNDENAWYPSYDADAEGYGRGLTVHLDEGENTITLTGINQRVDVDYLKLILEEDDEPETPAPQSVTVTADDASIQVGETTTVTAVVEPAQADQTVTWSTSDSGIATVDQNGTVTGVASGEATITATASDGETTGSITITVTQAEDPGTDDPDTSDPGTDEPGTDDPDTSVPSTDVPDTDEPGDDQTPGGSTGGGSQTGGAADGANPQTGGLLPVGAGLVALVSLCGVVILAKKQQD